MHPHTPHQCMATLKRSVHSPQTKINHLQVSCSSSLYPGRSLLWVTVLGFFIIYIYSVASFAVLRIFFDRNEGLFCETLGQCLLTNIKHGLLSTLGDVSENFLEPRPALHVELGNPDQSQTYTLCQSGSSRYFHTRNLQLYGLSST